MTTQMVLTDSQDGMTKREDNMTIVLGIMAPIFVVVVMLVILLFSFYNFHKRLHHKKKHHIDYVRANLPLKRPRISPPNMNTFNALDWKSRVTHGSKETKSFSKLSYSSVANEDVSDADTENPDVYGASTEEEDCRVTITDNLDLMSSKVKKSCGSRWKSNDKFDKYFFELVPTICQPESDYLPGDELFGKYLNT